MFQKVSGHSSHICNPSRKNTEFKASLDYLKPCLKNKQTNENALGAQESGQGDGSTERRI